MIEKEVKQKKIKQKVEIKIMVEKKIEPEIKEDKDKG
jgi:hypothetical protein